ncbi:MAG TPA: ABC transporter ATP-binding protein [Acidimicrobiales bacterium]|nr:ABC transporter ATP-binding protein [Acidimicrobiales bacterium]
MTALDTDTTQTAVLTIDGVSKRFGGLVAVDGASLSVPAGGAIYGLIGPNGAGKTTLFNCITGILRPDEGRVSVGDDDTTGWKPHRLAQRGLGRTFQRLEVFDTMTVEENIQVAVEATQQGRVFRGLFTLAHPTEADVRDRTDELISLVQLEEFRRSPVGGLPTGVGRLVELGRALAIRPRIVLLDEPASGLDAGETQFLGDVLRDVATREGVSLLLVEHDVELVLALCERIYVLDFGRLIAEGSPDEIQHDPAVRAAYLGEQESEHDDA